jgi:protein TonB
MGDELLEGEPGPPSPPGAVAGGTGEATALSANDVPVVRTIELISMTPPVYPPRCLRMGLEGVVRVRVLVGENGVPQEVTLAKSSGESSMDDAALKAVREWVFRPAMRNGMPARAWVVVPIEFKLID